MSTDASAAVETATEANSSAVSHPAPIATSPSQPAAPVVVSQPATQSQPAAQSQPAVPEGITEFDVDADVQHPAEFDHGMRFFGVDLSGPVMVMVTVALIFAILMPAFMKTTTWIDGLALLALVPSAIAGLWAHSRRKNLIQFRQLFARFCLGWLVLLPASWFFGFLFCIVWLVFCAILTAALPSIIVVIFLVFAVFTSIAATEEAMKYAVLKNFDNYNALPNPELYPLFSSATALGLGTGASYYIIIFVRILIDEGLKYSGCKSSTPSSKGHGDVLSGSSSSGSGSDMSAISSHVAFQAAQATWTPYPTTPSPGTCDVHMSIGMILVLVAVCVFFAQPMQLLASYHVGLIAARVEVLKQNFNASKPITVTILVRGLFFSVFVIFLVVAGPASFVPTILIAIGYLLYVKQYERKMPRSYLERVGYLNFFGYGLVSQDDTDGPTNAAAAASTDIDAV